MALSATTRRYSFRGVHSLTTGEHKEKCHGHQFYLEVSYHKCDVHEVDQVLNETVINKLDRHDLTTRVNPATGEVLVEWIHEQLEQSKLRGKIIGVALQETRKNRFVSARSDARLI